MSAHNGERWVAALQPQILQLIYRRKREEILYKQPQGSVNLETEPGVLGATFSPVHRGYYFMVRHNRNYIKSWTVFIFLYLSIDKSQTRKIIPFFEPQGQYDVLDYIFILSSIKHTLTYL